MAVPLQYQSQYIPTNFNQVGNMLGMFRQDMQQRNQQFDQAVAMQDMTLAEMAEQQTSDPTKQKELIESLRGRIDEAVQKKGMDYGAAAQDISRLISKEKSNPFYGFDKAKLAKMQEYGKLQKQMGLNFYADKDPSKSTLEDYLADPNSLEFKSFNKEQLRSKMAGVGKAAADLYTEDINREVAKGVREIGSAKGYRTPELVAGYMQTEGNQAITDLMEGYGIDPNNQEIRGELEQELISNIGGELKTQMIYPRETKTTTTGKDKKVDPLSLSSSQPMDNVKGTLPVKHPFWNAQANSKGSIATGSIGKSSPYVNKKLAGAYIPRGKTFVVGAGKEVKGGKAGTPVEMSFAPGEATYTGPMTVWRIQDVEQNTKLTEDMQERIGNAAFIGGDNSRYSIPGIGENEKPQTDSQGRKYYMANDGSKKAKVYVEETPVMSFSVVRDGEAFSAFETIENDRDRVLGEFGNNHPLPKPIKAEFTKQGDSYVVNNLRVLGLDVTGADEQSLSRVNNVTNELVSAVNTLSGIGSEEAINKANEINQGLEVIRNIRQNLSQGQEYIMTPQEKKLLLSIEDAYTEIEASLYGRQFKISETITPDIQ